MLNVFLWICTNCEAESAMTSSADVLPRGWERVYDSHLCPACLAEIQRLEDHPPPQGVALDVEQRCP